MNKLDVTGTNNPAYLDVAFTKDSITYFPIDSSVVHTTHANGIVTMEMPLTQFRNYKDPTDIQLIKATIRVRSNY